jgi:hypothetical protein
MEETPMSFTESDKTKILRLKSSISSYYNLQMKKIRDSSLEALFFENCVISGGCISSIFHDEAVADIDVYCKNAKALMTIKDYIISKNQNIKSVESYELDENGVKVNTGSTYTLITQNAVTLTNDVQYIYMDVWDNCKKKFDFVHCMPHYDLITQKLYISETQYNSIKNKILTSTNQVEIKQKRIEKYVKRGWNNFEGVVSQEYKWADGISGIGFTAQEITEAVV